MYLIFSIIAFAIVGFYTPLLIMALHKSRQENRQMLIGHALEIARVREQAYDEGWDRASRNRKNVLRSYHKIFDQENQGA